MKALGVFSIVAVFNCLCRVAVAQNIPFSPLFPQSRRECQAFSRQVQEYEASYSAQHEQCLAEHPADRQEAPNSPTCSRSSCQYLHDKLYGNYSLSVGSLRAEVEACDAKVVQHEKEQAEESAEEAERAARQLKREEEREKAEADRAAVRQQDKDRRDSQKAASQSELEKEAANRTAAEQKAAINQYALLQAAAAATAAEQASPHPRSNPSKSKANPDSSQTLVDPFSGSAAARLQEPDPSNRLVDPFSKSETLVDPFGQSAGKRQDVESAEVNKFTYEASTKILEESMSRIDTVLADQIKGIQSQAGKTISAAQASQQIQGIKDTQSVLQGLTHLMSGAQYAVLLKNILSAESPGKRDEATGEALKQISSDVLHRDAVKSGMTEVSLRLFGQRVGPLLVRAAAPTIAAGGILLNSEKTSRDPIEIIHDTTGKVSLSEKQSALMDEWRGYERRQSQTSNNPNPALQRALWIDSNIVYNQCIAAKSACDKWQPSVHRQ